jgi:hypothetical protein
MDEVISFETMSDHQSTIRAKRLSRRIVDKRRAPIGLPKRRMGRPDAGFAARRTLCAIDSTK